jgi:hypothetical protein
MEINQGTAESGVTGISVTGQPVLTGDVTLSEGANITLTQVGNNIEIASTGSGSYTFSTGLTNTAGTITANLSTGIAGGQTAIGGTASGESLTLSSTSNATKGKTLFGASGAYDEANGLFGIGTVSPAGKLAIVGGYSATNWTTNGVGLRIANATYTNTSSSGAVGGFTYIHTLGVPTIAASNVVTFANVTTLALGAPVAGSNVTITSPLTLYVASGDARFGGSIGIGTTPSSRFHIDGNFTTNSAWTTAGLISQIGTQTLTDNLSAGGTSITTRVANSFNTPTFASTNAVTITSAVNYYIQGAPTAGTNTTINNSYAMLVDSGAVRFDGPTTVGTGVFPTASLSVGGSISAAAWGTSGILLRVDGTAFTDTTSSGTVASAVLNSFAGDNLAASSTTTYTNAATVYIGAAPTASTNVTITAGYPLWVDTGVTRLDGGCGINLGTGETTTNLLTIASASSTDANANDQINLRSARAGIVAGSLIGAMNFSSNDSSLTAPGIVVSRIKAVSNVTQTTSALGTDIVFESTTGTTFAELVRIVGDGKVGIGTATPAGMLQVNQATLGSQVQVLTSTASNDDPIESTFQNKVTTTDATVTTLATIAIPASTSVMIEARVVARRTGGASGTAEDGAGYIVSGVYKNVAGTATEIGETSIFSAEDQAGWACTINVSGANALLQVTGAASNNVSWVATYRVYSIST